MQLISQNHQGKLIVLNLYHRLPRQATGCNKTSPWTSLKLLSNTLLTDFKLPYHTCVPVLSLCLMLFVNKGSSSDSIAT